MKSDAIPELNIPSYLTASADNMSLFIISTLLILMALLFVFFKKRFKTAFVLYRIAGQIKKNKITLRQAAYEITQSTDAVFDVTTSTIDHDDLSLLNSLKYMKDFSIEKNILIKCITRLIYRLMFGRY